MTDEELYLVRVRIGPAEASEVTDDQIEDRFAVLGSVDAVALEFLEARLGELLNDPGSLTKGDFSMNNAPTITALEKRIDEIKSSAGVAGSIKTKTAVRDDRRGR